jgi:hypothetical protein
MDGWMDVGFVALLKSLFVIDQCPVNINILAPKIWVLHMYPKTGPFSRKRLVTVLIEFQ